MHDSDAGEVLYLQVSAEGVVADETVLVSAEAFDGAYLDAEIDATDTLHIAYTSDEDYGDIMVRQLNYIKRTSSGIWSEVQTIDGGLSGQLERGQYVDIAIHNSPWLGTTPSFAYLNGDHGTPTLADVLLEGMEPIRFTVGTDYLSSMTYMDSGLYTAMDVDTEGRQHVAFFDPNASFGTAAQIQYTTSSGTRTSSSPATCWTSCPHTVTSKRLWSRRTLRTSAWRPVTTTTSRASPTKTPRPVT